MKVKNKITGEIREARIANEHLQLWSTEFEKWINYDDLDDLAKWWRQYEEPKEYWYIDWTPEIGAYHTSDVNSDVDERQKEIGNYFETKEEAEKAVEKLKAWKRLKDKGLKVTEWRHGLHLEKSIVGRFRYEFPIDNQEDIESDLDLLFGGEE